MTTNRPAGTLNNVATSTTTATLFSASTLSNIRGRVIWNDSAAILYVKFGATASATSATLPIAAGAVYVFDQPAYSGQVDGILASGTGTARVTEF